jgi:hypothetical protein
LIFHFNTVLSVGGVLQSGFSRDKLEILSWVSVSLTELLKAEATVSEDLSGNVSGGGDFNAGGDHFKWAPVLVPDQVSDEFFGCVCVELIGGIGHTGAIRNEFLRILDAHISISLCWL